MGDTWPQKTLQGSDWPMGDLSATGGARPLGGSVTHTERRREGDLSKHLI